MSKLSSVFAGARVRKVFYASASTVLLLGAVEGFFGKSADAHHAFSAEFDANQPIQLTGKITRLQWTNPHSWLYVDVTESDGAVHSWAIEFGAPYGLIQRGLRRTDFELGAEVVVDAFRARSGQRVANASSVRLSDGRDFFTAADDSPSAQSSAQ